MSARHSTTDVPHGVGVKVARGRPPVGSALLSEDQWSEITRAVRLSGRELQIVRGVFDNDTEHAIAADLGIADCTVHTHFDRLYSKLAVATRVELVLRIMETGLHLKLPPPPPGRLSSRRTPPHQGHSMSSV